MEAQRFEKEDHIHAQSCKLEIYWDPKKVGVSIEIMQDLD